MSVSQFYGGFQLSGDAESPRESELMRDSQCQQLSDLSLSKRLSDMYVKDSACDMCHIYIDLRT